MGLLSLACIILSRISANEINLHQYTFIDNHHSGRLKIPIYDHETYNYYAVPHPAHHSLPPHVEMLGHIIPEKYFMVATGKYEAAPDSGIPQIPRKQRLFKRDIMWDENDIVDDLRERQPIERREWTKLDPAYSSISDPLFHKQWHLANRESIGNDINPGNVWKQGFVLNLMLEITGKNVTVCFIDDGLDYNHADLKENFYADGSYDFNDHVKLPTPRLGDDRHGTRCAGEVAGKRNNDVCGVGIAWDSRVSGIRILSGTLTEADGND